jgi:hypothetical protein
VSSEALLVCPPALVRSAAELEEIGRRLASGPDPPGDPPAGGPAAGAALLELASAVRRRLDAFATDTAEVAALVRRAAAAYDAVDDRAVWRIRGSSR